MTASEHDPREIAARLGISESAVRRLQVRGILRHFDLGADEVRLRLWLGHQLAVQRLVMAGQLCAQRPAAPTARTREPEHAVQLDRVRTRKEVPSGAVRSASAHDRVAAIPQPSHGDALEAGFGE